jgi:hypothetical protein
MTEELTYAQQVAADRAAQLDNLLSQWHQWADSKRGVRGYASRALVCGEFRVSRQYDDVSGALDDELDNTTMKTLDFQVTEMAEPYRSAIYALAKNLTTGVTVFLSPRLPQSKEARDMVIAQARQMLTARLISAGVL